MLMYNRIAVQVMVSGTCRRRVARTNIWGLEEELIDDPPLDTDCFISREIHLGLSACTRYRTDVEPGVWT